MSRTLSDPTRVSHVNPDTQTMTTGILLWGPPGCGKSSSANRLKEQYQPMYFINTDAIVESIIHNYFEDDYERLKAEGTDAQKQDFYWKMRTCTFRDITEKEADTDLERIINNIFDEVYTNVPAPKEEELRRYALSKGAPSIQNLQTHSISDFLGDFTIFLTKMRKHHFMIETTGASFDYSWAKNVMANTNSILQVVFVSDPETLIDRVSRRIGQLVNAPPDRIRTTYSQSYFNSFTQAVASDLFDHIIVDVNDVNALTVLHLIKVEMQHVGKRQTSFPYTPKTMLHNGSHPDRDPTPQEFQFLTRLFKHTGVPTQFLDYGRHVVHCAIQFAPHLLSYI